MDDLFLNTTVGQVHARAAGSTGAPLVLGLHGWSQRNGWHTWETLMAPLAAAGFRVVSVDMPGWGESPPLPGGLADRGAAIRVVLAILDSLGSTRDAVLLGKSWGGDLALGLALDHPDRVAKLILTAPAFSDFGRLPELRPPLLLAWAEDDPVIPVAFAERYRAAPDAKLVIYPTGGHSAAPKNADAFAPVAIDFLQSPNPTPTGRRQGGQ